MKKTFCPVLRNFVLKARTATVCHGREHSKEHWQEQAGMVLLTIVVVSCKLTSSEPNTDRSHSRSLRRGSLQLVHALRHQLRSSF